MTRSTVAIQYQFTPVPSETLERLAAAGLTGREFRIILVVWRKTWGWSKEKDRISMSQFARATGIERRNCHVLVSGLIKRKIIKKIVVTNGDKKTINYQFNNIYSEWKPLLPVATKAKRKVVAIRNNDLSPLVTTILSPSITHTIDIDKTLSTESSGGPSDLLEGQGSPDNGKGLMAMGDILAAEAFRHVRAL